MTTLNDALVTIIQKTQGAVESGVSFLSEQIPDVIQQLLMWKFYEAVVWSIFGLLLFVVGTALVSKGLYHNLQYNKWYEVWRNNSGDLEKEAKLKYLEQEPKAVVYGIAGGFMGAVGIFGFCRFMINGMEAVQIYIAPKVWLIEYAASLAK